VSLEDDLETILETDQESNYLTTNRTMAALANNTNSDNQTMYKDRS